MLCTEGETFSDSAGVAFLADGDCSGVGVDVEGIDITLDATDEPIDQGGTGDIVVSMSNPYPVYGLEIHIEDAPESITAIDVSYGDLLADLDGTLSFSEVNGEIIVLWFSLTGQYIEAGSGELFTVSFNVNDDAPNGDVSLDLNDDTTFSDNLGQAMYWNYEGDTISVGLPDVYLTMIQTTNNEFEIHMDNDDVVNGFQFTIDDNPDYYSFISAEAGDRVPGDWSISGNENGGDITLLGFSFQGTSIEPGSGVIATVTVDTMDMDFVSELCFSDAVVSDPSAAEYFTFASCSEFVRPFFKLWLCAVCSDSATTR